MLEGRKYLPVSNSKGTETGCNLSVYTNPKCLQRDDVTNLTKAWGLEEVMKK